MKHKHADLIHQWADGAEIQVLIKVNTTSQEWVNEPMPAWSEYAEYRIKPSVCQNTTNEEKKPVVRWLWAFEGGSNPWGATSSFYTEEELRNLNPPKHIKLEWSRTEFPE